MKNQILFPALGLLLGMFFPGTLFTQAPPSGIALALCPGYKPAPDPTSHASSEYQSFAKTVQLLDAVPEPDGSVLAWCMANQGTVYTWSDNRPHSPDTLALFSARFSPNGQLDTSYGQNGWVQYQTPDFTAVRRARPVRQTDGKWLVAVEFSDQKDIALVRFHPDGRLDTSFRNNGYVYFVNDAALEDELLLLRALPDGKIRLLASSRYGINDSDCRLIQLQENGYRDTTFDIDGVLRLLEHQIWLGDAAVHSDGRITLSSYDYGWLHLHRFMPDGRPDASFGLSGHLRSPLVSIVPNYFTPLPGGRLILRGMASRFCETGQPEGTLRTMELDARGQPDSVFVRAGSPIWSDHQYAVDDTSLLCLFSDKGKRVLWVSGPGGSRPIRSAPGLSNSLDLTEIIRMPTGHIWLLGDTKLQSGALLLALRLLPDGSLDPAFGLDSLAVRAHGYRPYLDKKGENIVLGLEELNPRILPFSVAGLPYKDSVEVLRPYVSYASKFKNNREPLRTYTLEYAARSGKAGQNLHLYLSDETILPKAGGWAGIPAERLQGLSLINCRFEGIPKAWPQFKNLELLEIRFASADEARRFPLDKVLAGFPHLEVLILSMPDATKVPASLFNLKKLRILELDLPQLEHFPKGILRLNRLQELRLTFRCPDGLPAQLEQLSALEILDIKGSGPSASLQLPETLGQLGQLKEVHLRNGVRPATLPPSLGQLSQLSKLTLANAVVEALPDAIGQCLLLRELVIQSSGVFQGLPADVFKLQDLEKLIVDVCAPDRSLRVQAIPLQHFESRARIWTEIRLDH